MTHLIRTSLICIVALAAEGVMAQSLSPVFTDNFLNGSTTGTTSIPGGTPTASYTSYNFASTKNATASAIASGTLRMTFAATTSGFAETQAVFSSTPVRLTSVGDAINFRYTFVDTANVLTSATTWNPASSYLWAGLYDTGTAASVPLTTLANSGLTATATTGVVVTGGVSQWQGYVQRIAGPGGTTQSVTRPAQVSGTSSAAQDLVGNNLGSGAYNAPAGTTLTATGSTQTLASQLVIGGTYTMDYTLTLVDSSTLSVRSYLYDGSGTSGSVLVSQTRLASGTNLLTTKFSGLAFGVRYSGSSSGAIVMDVTSLSVQATNAPTPPPPSGITINVASGTQTQTAAGYPLLSGSQPLAKTGAGTLVVDQANTLTGSTSVQEGTLQLANGSALASSKVVPLAGGTVSLSPYLETTVGGLDPNVGGIVDVGNGKVTVASGLSATSLVTALVAGRGDGSWSGTSGITSSTAAAAVAASIPRSVGWLDNGDGTVTAAFAAPGDTNLDWSIDILDAGNFLAGGKFDTGLPASWGEGDFSYDGIVDILDAADFFATGLYDAGNYNAASGGAGGVAAVPEPSTLALLATVAVVGAVRLRQRRAA